MRDALTVARACAERMYAGDRASQDLGIEIEVVTPGEVRATMVIRPDMVNGHDICHGGLIFTLADTAFAFACNAYDHVSVAAQASIDFLSPGKVGETLVAHATELHRGRRNGLYEVRVNGPGDRLVALFRGRSAGLGKPMLGGAGE
ncbi:MAG: hydroxyphenylacetyl-CoA thioesterase PaaI [Gammaproteobacteria bacterium]|nr:hydroxyphenylacetyl-CoA thioesterase PaaI [Gammaproteobacteria bacterium]NND61155.1 hydroxyphenylacetyl-CoA thioesterase PaaI [Gammaproteobacteria bacterium]